MSHCDDEDLSLIALGEPAAAEDLAHLSDCADCRARLDQLTAVASLARSIQPGDRPLTPPAAVWTSIQDEIASDPPANVVSLDERRRRPRLSVVAASAAAVGLLVGGSLVALLTTSSSNPEQVVASATLDPIDNSGVTGTAKVESGSAGNELTVDLPGLSAPGEAYYEVWMATPDTSTMVAVGTLRPGEPVTFSLPAGLDPTAFPVVDVSLEKFDGDAAHSATSIARGHLAM